jgi:hypothetical protein
VNFGGEVNSEHIAKTIYEDNVDILVDFKGRMLRNQLDIFLYRPAPVQFSWIAYPGSTGIKEMDYYVSDCVTVTDSFKTSAYEKCVCLPICYQANNDTQFMLKCEIPVVPDNLFVLGNFNFKYKMDDRTIVVYKRLLKEIPNSILALLNDNHSLNEKALVHFEEFKSRINFVNYMEKPKHLYRLHKQIDVCLDPFNCNSHTTASDILFAGTPIVTMPGESFQSRVCASILTACGLTEFIAYSEDEYVEKVKALVNMGKPALQKKKEYIRAKLLESSLFNSYIYSEYFFNFVNKMWDNHVNQIHDHIYPEHIDEFNHLTIPGFNKKWKNKTITLRFTDVLEIPIYRLVVDNNHIIISGIEKEIYINYQKVFDAPTVDKIIGKGVNSDLTIVDFIISCESGSYYFNFAPGFPTMDEYKARQIKLNKLTKGEISIGKPFALDNEISKIIIEVK